MPKRGKKYIEKAKNAGTDKQDFTEAVNGTVSDLNPIWPLHTLASLQITMHAADLYSVEFVCG